jgi:hypothetical protein
MNELADFKPKFVRFTHSNTAYIACAQGMPSHYVGQGRPIQAMAIYVSLDPLES